MNSKETFARLLLADANEAADRAVEEHRARKAENALRTRVSTLPVDSQERADFIVLLTMIDRLRESASQWVPVSERLPDEDGSYLGMTGKSIDIVRFYKGQKYFLVDAGVSPDNVTHWMPLPLAPTAHV